MSKELTPRQLKDLGQIEDCSDSVQIHHSFIDVKTTSKDLFVKGIKRIEITHGGNFKSEDLLKGLTPCKRDGN